MFASSPRRPSAAAGRLFSLAALLLLLLPLLAPLTPGEAAPRAAAPTAPDRARVEAGLRSSPVMFIENVGQFDERARFQVRGATGTMWLAEEAVWITVVEQTPPPAPPRGGEGGQTPPSFPGKGAGGLGRRGVALKLTFPGANPHPRLEPFDRLATHVSSFLGNDPARWRPDVPAWGGVRYVDLYPGVDLELTGKSGYFQPRLVVRDATALAAVRLHVEGTDSIEVLPSPNSGRGAGGEGLRLTTAAGSVTFPLLQLVGGDGAPLAPSALPSRSGATLRAPFAAPLSAKPDAASSSNSDLLYGTFLGAGSSEGSAVAVDGAGSAYVTGYTYSTTFPTTPGAFDTSFNGGDYDAFVTKLNASGSALAYSTFLGGGSFDHGYGIAVDEAGNAYVTGYTYSTTFPTTPGFDTSYNGWGDAFVTKLNASGSALAYSTFLGGGSWDYGYGIAVDGVGSAYITGFTGSSTFPTTPGFDTSYNGGGRDAFVTKLNASGSALAYSTFLGSGSEDWGSAIAVDGEGSAYITGFTRSSAFPTTPGAFDTSYNGDYDAFVTKLNASGSALAYSTFLGGRSSVWGYGIVVDGVGNAYVTGRTTSSDFPTTPGAFDTSHNGGWDAFVTKLSASGSALTYSTFLGSGSDDYGYSIAVDGAGSAYVTGYTWSTDFPTTASAFDTSHNGGWDAFMTKLNASGSTLTYSTFLGGGDNDRGYGIAVDGVGSAYVTGDTWSADFPTTPGAFDTSHNGGWPAFVTKLAVGGGVCPDFDDSGDVDVADIQAVAGRWRRRSSDPGWDPRFDLDGDGDINLTDIMLAAAQWNQTCP